MNQFLQENLKSVNLEDAADADLAYLMRVEQLELLGALIEAIAQGDAVATTLAFVKITLLSLVS